MEKINTENGEYCILFDPCGTLAPNAKEKIQEAAALGAECIYGDESYPGINGWVPIRKPDYAPDTLLSYNCIGMPLAVSAPLYHALGAFSSYRPEPLYLFTLRAMRKASFVHHIPQVLYYGNHKPEPLPNSDAIRRALCEAAGGGSAQRGLYPGSFYLRHGRRGKARVSVVCISEGAPDALRQTLESVACASSFTDCAFVVAHGGVPDGRAKAYLDALEQNQAARVVYAAQGGNRAELMNLGAKAAHGDVLLFLDAGITLGAHDAIERLITLVQRKGVGAAGGRIVTRDGKIVQAGLAFGLGKTPASLFAGEENAIGAPLKNQTVFALRNVSAVSRAFAIRAATFQAARGFDETFPAVGAQAELCLRLMRAGHYNIYDPRALFRLPEMPEKERIPDANRQRLNDVFRVFSIEGDPMAGRGAWLDRR